MTFLITANSFSVREKEKVLLNCYNNRMSEKSITGTYVYDKKLGKMVKVSDRIPSASKKEGGCCCGNCACHGH